MNYVHRFCLYSVVLIEIRKEGNGAEPLTSHLEFQMEIEKWTIISMYVNNYVGLYE